MKKLVSLLKAVMSQDMSLFKYKVKPNSSRLKQVLFPLMIFIIIMSAVASYAYMFAVPLSKVGLTYVMLTLFIIFVTVTTFIEGIYKSQGILFEAKDNDILFSLPIDKSKIFFIRMFKLLVFQIMYNSTFILPAFIVYIFFENPGVNFYIISFLMLILIPIIPTVLGATIGYIVKAIAARFKSKKIVQTVLSIVTFFAIFYLSYNIQGLIENLAEKATSINDLLIKIYLPVGIYIELIQEFSIVSLIKLLLVNIIPLVLFLVIGSKYYFNIITKSSNVSSNHKVKNSEKLIKAQGPMVSLIKKELNRYFSSPVYIFNTAFGIILMLIITIYSCFNPNILVNMINKNQEMNISMETIMNYLPKVFCGVCLFTACMTSITSSSISLEGKAFNLTKSLPIKEEKILLAKVLTSNIISMPIMLISDIIFIIKFKTAFMDSLAIFLVTLIVPTVIAMIGLLVNLKYPKMNASNDTEVVKQSMSSVVSVFIGMFISMISVGVAIQFDNILAFIYGEIVVLAMAVFILWNVIRTYGVKMFKNINV